MEQLIRPVRKEVPESIVIEDLANLSRESDARTLLVSDALFKSFDLFPFLRSLGMKINFETRCDVIDPSIIRKIADVCGVLALGFESASYETLKRMNKIRDRNHYEHYISNTTELFHAAVNNALPIIVFFIAGYPGDTKKDLEISLEFARKLSKNKGPGGHVFKVGECRAYPKTRTYDLAGSLPGVVFDDDGVFGQNIVREPSQGVHFDTVLTFMKQIFAFSHPTDKLNQIMVNMMPFFRLPALALRDETIPGICFADNEKNIFNVQREGLQAFRKKVPALTKKYKEWMSLERSTRNLPI
jgi:hypothetical protein